MGTSRAYAEQVLRQRAEPPRKAKRQPDPEQYLAYRVRILPEQLARARARLAQLEAEALEFGFTDLVERRA